MTDTVQQMSFATRLRAALDDTGKSHESLAEHYRWSTKLLAAWLAGEKEPQDHRIRPFIRDYKVSFDWLYCGDGKMHR